MYHTVVIGGGCLGAATAVSLQKKLNKLGKGEKVGLIIGASGYDKKRWENPELFIPDRKILNNNSFGAGIHFCIGAPLARLEISIALKCFFEVYQRSKLSEKPKYADIYHFHGLENLKVKLES